MEKNQPNSFFASKLKAIGSFILVLILVIGMNSCKSKPGNCLKTFKDSATLANFMLTTHLDSLDVMYNFEVMPNLVFSAADQQALFASPQVMQIRFDWTPMGGTQWGLTAVGLDNNAQPVAGIPTPRLAPSGIGNPYTNVARIPKRPLFLSRGQMKALLGLPESPDPIVAGFTNILMSAAREANPPNPPGYTYLYYGCSNETSGAYNAANPSPPATSPCLNTCDQLILVK